MKPYIFRSLLACIFVASSFAVSLTAVLAASGPCGTSPSDWCDSLKSDPCGVHRDKGSCMADRSCEGMPYRGESVVSCQLDSRGFASNCPTVGCVSGCQAMKAELCGKYPERCVLKGDTCEQKPPK